MSGFRPSVGGSKMIGDIAFVCWLAHIGKHTMRRGGCLDSRARVSPHLARIPEQSCSHTNVAMCVAALGRMLHLRSFLLGRLLALHSGGFLCAHIASSQRPSSRPGSRFGERLLVHHRIRRRVASLRCRSRRLLSSRRSLVTVHPCRHCASKSRSRAAAATSLWTANESWSAML